MTLLASLLPPLLCSASLYVTLLCLAWIQFASGGVAQCFQVIAASFYDFSVSELMRLLCFEDEDQIVAFLGEYSLRVSSSGQVRRANMPSSFCFFLLFGITRVEKRG